MSAHYVLFYSIPKFLLYMFIFAEEEEKKKKKVYLSFLLVHYVYFILFRTFYIVMHIMYHKNVLKYHDVIFLPYRPSFAGTEYLGTSLLRHA